MTPLYVSFYTKGNGYADEAAQLVKTLIDHRLDHRVEAVESLGGWQKNTQIKPRFILDCMRGNPGRPIVWLDADARVIVPPTLFESLDCDVAAVWKDDVELLASTIYFGPTPAAKTALKLWVNENIRNPNATYGDQENFQAVVERMQAEGKLKVKRLSPRYALIFDLMREHGPAVILQTQCSRRLRQ